ncbi:MAG: chemotaxis protein CheA [Piscirickettsiaceae bacterium]|nr:chemotaxis protein CheA [Piscirickettsiaceae bacterium]
MSDLDLALETFKQEAKELLDEMENALLALEDTPDDNETINSLFRAMHTIKGSSGLFGFSDIVAFTHEAETILDQVRNGERSINDQLISVLLDCKDHTEKLLAHCIESPEQDLPEELSSIGKELVFQLTGEIQEESLPAVSDVIAAAGMETVGESSDLSDKWIISLAFKSDALRMGVDPLSFLRYLKTLGDIETVLVLTDEIPAGDEFDPESCYLHLKVAYKSNADKQTIEDVFEFASDDCDINILPPHSKIEDYLSILDELESDVDRLGDILINIGVLTKNDVAKAVQKQNIEGLDSKPIGEILVEQHVVQPELVDKALKKQQQVKQKVAKEASYIRVDSSKLGQLINLVGELVISGAAMDLMVERHGLTDVEEVAETLNTLVSNIRDIALDLRMVPIGETFTRFKRVVRDVGKELGKDIELKITGGETELDKTVVEKINDPLTHLIRNSLDHGVETPAQREQAGKTERGCIQLNAYHQSGHIVIQIIDNGAGLDTEKILAKAIANGLIPEDHNLSQQEIFNLIFEAGLSTKPQATDLSGRGVGMDVVRRNIEGLRGNVNIDSVAGQGTTITIQLPLTLAIIDGFMVEASNERYIIPLTMVEECVEMNSDEWKVDEVQHYVNLRGVALPYLRLGEYFNAGKKGKERKEKGRESLVVVRSGQNKAGFVVDELHGEHQTVIKPLGKVFENLAGLTGATVLGDGNVALILDVQGLIQKAVKSGRH